MEIELKFKEFLEHYSKALSSFIRKIDHNEQLTSELINLTSYLPSSVTTSQRLYHFKYTIPKTGTCKICNKDLIYKDFKKGYRTYCNSTCANKDPEFQKKKRDTTFKNNGYSCVFTTKEFKENFTAIYKNRPQEEKQAIQAKRKKTSLSLHGKEHHLQTEEGMNKQRQTNMLRRGVPYAMQSQETKDRHKQYFKDMYGVENPSQIEEVKNKNKHIQFNYFYEKLCTSDRLKDLVKPLFTLKDYKGIDKRYSFQCIKCNNIFEDHLNDGRLPRCFKCFPHIKGTSQYEFEIFDWLRDLNISNISDRNRQLISPLELDFYLPDYNLAIEFNGLYYHAEKSSAKTKSYHLNKTNSCKNKDTQLLHIFEDEWVEKKEIVKSIIKNKLGMAKDKIQGRKCILKEIMRKDAFNFLFENHLQKPIAGKYNYGLYHNDELVYLMCFSKSRYNKNYDYELLRSCCKINTQVLGGFDKLIKYASKSLTSTSIISYVDKRYFSGSGYKNWKYMGDTEPNYFYTKDYKVRESRLKYQKHKLSDMSSELTEWENMQLAGFDRIWDCGNMIFTLRP